MKNQAEIKSTYSPIADIKGSWKIDKSELPTLGISSSSGVNPADEVRTLVGKIGEIDAVLEVRALAPQAKNLKRIKFEVKLKPETDLAQGSWDLVRNLVIDYSWNLRDRTKEKWYFHADLVEYFGKTSHKKVASYPQEDATSKLKIIEFPSPQLEVISS